VGKRVIRRRESRKRRRDGIGTLEKIFILFVPIVGENGIKIHP
jgi:hypothetical protein